MSIKEITPQRYAELFGGLTTVFGSVEFTELNRAKAESVKYLVEDDDAPAFGIIVGLRDGVWHCPFSAPFGEIAFSADALNGLKNSDEGGKSDVLRRLNRFVVGLRQFVGAGEFEIVMPPAFYDPERIGASVEALRNEFSNGWEDVDFYYPLNQEFDFKSGLNRAARKNFNRAEAAGFQFEKTDDVERAYSVIKTNRDSKGYRLAMTLDDVLATIRVVQADFFVLSLDGEDVAAAMAYRVTPDIVQIIYWGDVPGYGEQRPMNILPYHIFGYYAERGISIIDIGPSSTPGVRNEGLCRFKTSLRCLTTPKPTIHTRRK